MAETGIFASAAIVQRKAGTNANAIASSEAAINDFLTQAEAEINVATTFNWSDAYDSLNIDTKGILKEAASNLAAIYIINYDMSGFTSREEAQTMLDVLLNGYQRCLSLLRVKDKQTFMDKT